MVWQFEQGPVTLAEEMSGINRIKERISPKVAENAATLCAAIHGLATILPPPPYSGGT